MSRPLLVPLNSSAVLTAAITVDVRMAHSSALSAACSDIGVGEELREHLGDGIAEGAECADGVGEVGAARRLQDLLARQNRVVDLVADDVLVARQGVEQGVGLAVHIQEEVRLCVGGGSEQKKQVPLDVSGWPNRSGLTFMGVGVESKPILFDTCLSSPHDYPHSDVDIIV